MINYQNSNSYHIASSLESKRAEKTWWKNYKSTWEKDATAEFNRILAVSPPFIQEKMQSLYVQGYANSRRFAQGNMLGHALAIKAHYSATHDTFIHGQKLSLWVFNRLTKDLFKFFKPEQDVSLYHFMRIEKEDGGEKIDPQYCINHADEIIDHNPEWRDQMISCDAYFFNEHTGESVDYFVKVNGNVMTKCNDIVRNIFSKYCQDIPEDLVKEVISIADRFSKEETIGMIYAISIPKHLVGKAVYFSHPMGNPCQCSEIPEYPLSVLKEHQNDTTPAKLDCRNGFHYPISQYRICTDSLNPNDHRIFCLSALNIPIKQAYKLEIQNIAKKLLKQLLILS